MSNDDNIFGSKPAACSNFGSIPANIFGSIPIPLNRLDVDVAKAAAVEVEEDDEGKDVFGDLLCSSLFTLARDGGLGEGEDLDVRGDGADLWPFGD